MFAKLFAVGIISAIMTGGAVYYSTAPSDPTSISRKSVSPLAVPTETKISDKTPETKTAVSEARVTQIEQEPSWLEKIRSSDSSPVQNTSSKTTPVSDTAALVLQEVEKIETDEMKDQAYFSLVNYALREKDFNTAKVVINKISRAEIRETARINLAIAYADNGQGELAFSVAESIEAPEYKDILRLQVVEALTHENSETTGQ